MELLEKAEPIIRQAIKDQCFGEWCKNPDDKTPAIKMELIDDFLAATMGMHNE